MEEAPKEHLSDYDFGRRILLAEDLEFNAEIAAEFLGQAGITVEVAENGALALNRFKASKAGYYDLIFMDIQMPELDGYQTTRAIRALDRPDARTIPIVAMTANAFLEDVQKAKESGMNGHIAKPLNVQELIEQLKKHFGDCKRKTIQ